MQQVGDPSANRLHLQRRRGAGTRHSIHPLNSSEVAGAVKGGSKAALGRGFCSAQPAWAGCGKAQPSLRICITKREVNTLGRLRRASRQLLPCSAEELSLSNISERRVRGDMIIIGKCLHREKIQLLKGSSIRCRKAAQEAGTVNRNEEQEAVFKDQGD